MPIGRIDSIFRIYLLSGGIPLYSSSRSGPRPMGPFSFPKEKSEKDGIAKAIAMFIGVAVFKFVVMLTVGAMQQARGLRLGCKSCKSGLRLRRCSIIN